jgi:hypothetical protein
MGSFAVERFGLDRLKDLSLEEIHARVRSFKEMTSFEHTLPAGVHV